MSELNFQNMEHGVLEADIEKLSKEIAEKRNLLEHKNLSERELVRKSLEPIIKQMSASSQQSDVNGRLSDIPVEDGNNQILPDYLKDSPNEIKIQVEKLIDLVFHQGIMKAVKEAQKTGGFVLDAFH